MSTTNPHAPTGLHFPATGTSDAYPWTINVQAVHAVNTETTRITVSDDGATAQLTLKKPWQSFNVPYALDRTRYGGLYHVHATATPDPITGTWTVNAWAVPALTDPATLALAELATLAGDPHITTRIHPRPPKRAAGTVTDDATAQRVYSLIVDAAHRAAIAAEYAPILAAVPGLTLTNITYPKSMSGTWHGHRFTLRAKGRKAILHIRAIHTPTENDDAHQPLWTGTAELTEPLPFFAQLSGTAAEKYLTALRLTTANLRIADGRHDGASRDYPDTMPYFTVTPANGILP